MASDLPTEFDFIVLGTGLPESILAAAFSRNGYKVLHLDRNDHYSDQWASFNLRGLEKISEPQKERKELKVVEAANDTLKDGENLLMLPTVGSLLDNIKIQYFVGDEETNKDIKDDLKSLEIGDTEDGKDDNKENTVQQAELEESAVSSSESKSSDTYVTTTSLVSEDSDAHIEDRKSSPATTDNAEDIVAMDTDSTKPSTESTNSKNMKDVTTANSQAITSEPPKSSTEDFSSKQKKIWNRSEINNNWRSFNIDLAPKLLYSSGKMVELLISSDVAKYCEFRTVSRVLTQNNAQIEKIPCSRADVFSSKDVSMLDKRKLMKFLEWCAGYHKNPQSYQEFSSHTFHDVLRSKNLSDNLQNIIKNAIAMVTPEALLEEGLEKTQLFLQSVGRYGNTPCLFPLYGSGELPQAFCRLCAVFGGIYCLMMSANSLILDESNNCQAIITSEGQRINCKWLIMGSSYSPEQYIQTDKRQISRCILLTNRSLLHTETQELSLLWIPPSSKNNHPISVLELPQSAMVCPKDMYLIHLTTEGTGDPEADLSPFIQLYFTTDNQTVEEEKVAILWSAYFSQPCKSVKDKDNIPNNVFILEGPNVDIDLDQAVVQAKEVFEEICPDDVFLPKPPHPDDIIYVDETEATVGGGETWDGLKDGQVLKDSGDNDNVTGELEMTIPGSTGTARHSDGTADVGKVSEKVPETVKMTDDSSVITKSDLDTSENSVIKDDQFETN